MIVEVDGFNWIVHSTIMKEVGTEVGINILPENIHIMKKVIDK